MLGYISRLFGRQESGRTAKERLRLVLVHDRASVSPELLEDLKEELIQVISKYMEIDVSEMEVAFDREDDSVALVANIPVRQVKRNMAQTKH